MCEQSGAFILEREMSESYFRAQRVGVLTGSLVVRNFGILKMEDRKYLLYSELKESENHPSTRFKKLWVGGGWWVSCDYSVSSAPFVLN